MILDHRQNVDAPRPALPAHRVRQVAVAAQVDPATVRRVLEGRPTRPMTRERVEKALAELGLQR